MTLFLLVLFTALVFEYINGFHDTANAIATSVATKALHPRHAILMAASFNFIGAFAGTAVAGIDYTTAETILADYDTAFPGVVEFMRTVERVARDRRRSEGAAYLTAPSGRRQPVDDGAYYRGVNYLIQGTAADVLKRALVDLDAAGLGDYLVLPVHDEVIADVPAGDAEDLAHEIERVMTDQTTFAVPLTASADVMVSRWGDKYR